MFDTVKELKKQLKILVDKNTSIVDKIDANKAFLACLKQNHNYLFDDNYNDGFVDEVTYYNDSGLIDLDDFKLEEEADDNDESNENLDLDQGLMLSLDNKACVDIEYISKKCNKDKEDVIIGLSDSIYQNPKTWRGNPFLGFETSDEYLSGDILYKYNAAKKANEKFAGRFEKNVNALEKLINPRLTENEIYVTLGSPWVPEGIIDEFICHLFGISFENYSLKESFIGPNKTIHDTKGWNIPNKNRF